MKVVPGNALSIDSKLLANPVLQGPLVRDVIDFLEMNQDRHVQVSGQRVRAAQFGSVGGDVKFHLAETLRSILHGSCESLFGIGLRHVVAVEPGEPIRCDGLKRLHLADNVTAREEIGFRHAGSVEVREVVGRPRTKMEVKIENR